MGQVSTWFALLPTLASLALWGAMWGGFAAGMRRGRCGSAPWIVVPPRAGSRGPRASAADAAGGSAAPRVSILKPLAGVDDELAENLASFAAIAYPSFEILLGVATVTDPAFAVAHAFAVEHPELDVRIVITDFAAAPNPKVAQLRGLEARAKGEVIVVSDSNVRVEPDYLTELVAALDRTGAGLVSSVLSGAGERTLGAALENLQIGAHASAGVVASALLAGQAITVGKSLAMRRGVLSSLGGFARVGDVLAEDHALGRVMREAGYPVVLSLRPVANWNAACSLGKTIARHVRWAKLRRSIHPIGYCFEPFACPIAIATACFALHPCRWSVSLMVIAMLSQATGAVQMMKLVRRGAPRWYWGPLEIARSYVTFFCWVTAFTGGRVQWRGSTFELGPGSRIRTDAGTSARDSVLGRSTRRGAQAPRPDRTVRPARTQFAD